MNGMENYINIIVIILSKSGNLFGTQITFNMICAVKSLKV